MLIIPAALLWILESKEVINEEKDNCTNAHRERARMGTHP
jgi:hypothetical protein